MSYSTISVEEGSECFYTTVFAPLILNNNSSERNLNIPLLNDHDLGGGKLVSRGSKITVDMAPTVENAYRYSALTASWGKDVVNSPFLFAVKEIGEGDSESENEHIQVVDTKWPIQISCRFCEKLGASYSGHKGTMRRHMKARCVVFSVSSSKSTAI